MSNPETNNHVADARRELDEVWQPVAQQLQDGHVQRETKSRIGLALPLLVFPIFYLVLVGLGAAAGADLRMHWIVFAVLCLAVPLMRVYLRRREAQKHKVAAEAALVAIDRELKLSDRMMTAHEFVEAKDPSGFQLAAIRDAQKHMAAARAARLHQPIVASETPPDLWLAGAVAALLFWGAGLISAVAGVATSDPTEQHVAVVTEQKGDQVQDNKNEPEVPPKAPEQKTPRQTREMAGSSIAGKEEAESDASRRGKNPIGSGRSAQARAAVGGGSERGQPSNQAQSTKGAESQRPKPKKKKPAKKDDKVEQQEENKPPQESGSTMGRGSGKGSSKSPTASPWSAKDQVVSDDEQDPEEDEEVDDENDESKARGGVQPNLRQRKPPVNRDLQISMGSGKPQDDANGRGGPGGPKKQRGVAQLVLGVTFPDHVSAKPNPGMSKITQERIEPQPQDGDSISGEGRGKRAAPMGHLSRRVLSPWMQDLVRSFYLSLREEGKSQ